MRRKSIFSLSFLIAFGDYQRVYGDLIQKAVEQYGP